MIRRGPASMKLTVAAWAILLGLQATSAQADGISSTASAGTAVYTLTDTTAIAAATGPRPDTPNTTLNGTVTTGSATVTVPSTTGLAVGYGVSGAGIPSNTTVAQINTGLSQVTLSQSATASSTSESLTFTPTIAGPQVVALIQPAGGVPTPPATATEGPLTILSASPGVIQSGVYDYLASTTSNGQNIQALGLSFYGSGLAVGDSIKFSLSVANENNPPQLIPQALGSSQTPPVTITLDSSSSNASTSSSPGADSVPEPLSLVLWSVIAGAGLVRAGVWRRASSAASLQ